MLASFGSHRKNDSPWLLRLLSQMVLALQLEGRPKHSVWEWIKKVASHYLNAAIVLVTMYALTRRLGG